MAAAPPGLPTPPTGSSPEPPSEFWPPRPRPSAVLVRLLVAVLALGSVAAGCILVVARLSVAPVATPAPASLTPSAASPATRPSSPARDPDADSAAPFPPPPGHASKSPATSAPTTSPDPTPTTTPAPPTPLSTPRPRGTQTLGAPSPTKGRGLTDNDLYDVALTRGAGRCQVEIIRPNPPLPDRQLVDYLDTLTDCITSALGPVLAKAGIDLDRPTIKAYRDAISTPCGWLEPTTAPAYYCSGDSVIYVPYDGDDQEAYTEARLGYLALIAHEYGHHLQGESGIFDDYTTRYYKAKGDSRNLLSRRLELQADCFGGVFLAYVSDIIGLSERDRAELERWHQQTGDDDAPGRPADHGSSAAQIRWLERGLDRPDYGRCDTWSAAVRDVT